MSASSVLIMENMERSDLLRYLAEYELDGAAAGIARLVADKGRRGLTEKQEAVYEKFIEPYFDLECACCHYPIPISEIQYALANGDGLCSSCNHRASKDD